MAINGGIGDSDLLKKDENITECTITVKKEEFLGFIKNISLKRDKMWVISLKHLWAVINFVLN